MGNISKLDKNFAVGTNLKQAGIAFYDVQKPPFRVHGVFWENGKFRRMPEQVAVTVSEGVAGLHVHTAGGRVRFRTDSPYVAISSVLEDEARMPHFALSGSMGFDLYADSQYAGSFIPPYDAKGGYESLISFPDGAAMREITVNFPLYSGVRELYIGVDEHAIIEAATPYRTEKPVVFYGSSITQGGCASRPGMSYESILSRRLQCDFINLGFSGNARAEDAMADYIKQLDMSLFVYDYDHNAPTVEHLQRTHEKLFLAVRKANPQLPIILMNRPKACLTAEEQQRRAIIEKTCRNAIAAGDTHVYLIDNIALTRLCGGEGTVDNCHPTDFGFVSMARALGDVIEQENLLGQNAK